MNRFLLLVGSSILICLSLRPSAAKAQDTVYYRLPRLRVTGLKDCDYYSVKTKDPVSNNIHELQFRPDGQQLEEQHYYVLDREKIKYGRWQTWYADGKLKSVINYKDNRKDGMLETYWPNGQLKRRDTFVNDSCISGICYDRSGKELKHFDYETPAHFPGGNEALYDYLFRKIYFPQSFQPLEGKVVVRFLVTDSGKIEDLTIMNNPEKNMAGQVLHAFKKMPEWVPATIDGEPMSEYVTFPVSFVRN
ncbi:MAG TPA: energy transducer TonB [Edaphocola sp.]|nr:energy transducer TonB [Edaphocola sp.]